MPSELILDSLTTDCVPGEVEYAVLLPPGYAEHSSPLPLLINMHGGGLDRNFLAEPEVRGMYEKLWEEGSLPPMVVACYSARGSWHLNYRDSSECWQDFAFHFIDYMRERFAVGSDPAHTWLTGISMGAMGSLRLLLKYPDRFGGVAAMEGIINPVLDYDDLRPRNYGFQHNLPPEEQARRWGWPVDRMYYRINNHANIAADNAPVIREYAPKIYLECGDRDYFNGQDGAEFLHRVLWQHRISHEYRLLQGCDHVGSSLAWRTEEAHRWLGRMVSAALDPSRSEMPEPTKPQSDYFQGMVRGEILRPPEESEKIGLFDDVAITTHRRYLPEFITRYNDAPFEGVFRDPPGEESAD